MSYIDKNGEKQIPVVLHRAIFGTFDRFTAFIIEETKGAFPLWLSPVQINIIPVNNDIHSEYSKSLLNELNDKDIRVKLDDRDEKLSYKMRESQSKKIPLTVIIGDKEKNGNLVSYRKFGETETTTLSKDEFIKNVLDCINNKNYNL